MSDEAKDLYVSSVEGHLVTRHGTGLYIGAERDAKAEGGLVFNPELVVQIPEAEARAYSREYGRALRDGSLVQRSKADFDAQLAKLDEQAKKEGAEREAKAKADEAAKARAETPTTRELKPKTGPARGAGETKE